MKKKKRINLNIKSEFGSFLFPLGGIARNKSVWAKVPKIYWDLNDKNTIYSKNNRSGVYGWTNKISGASYIGSSTNFTRRLPDYFSPKFLEKEVIKTKALSTELY